MSTTEDPDESHAQTDEQANTLDLDYVGVTSENNSFDDRPATRKKKQKPEPLDDSVEDCYRLYEPIATSPEVVADPRYLDGEKPLTAFEAVGTYMERRHGENVSAEKHGYHRTRQWRARLRYATGKEMDRQLLAKYDDPTIALLSLRLSPGDRSRLTLLTGLYAAFDPTLGALRYRLQEAADAPLRAEEWEYIAVVAGTSKRATPHLHILVYCDGDVPREVFTPVVSKWVEKCPSASERGHSPKGAIRIRGNGSDTIPRMDDAPEESAGATYVLAQLPHLEAVDKMARDELLHSSTIDAWGGRAFRKSDYDVWGEDEPSAEEICDVTPTSSIQSDGLTEIERAFVTQYVEEVGDFSAERICGLLEANADEFDGEPDPQRVVPAIRERL